MKKCLLLIPRMGNGGAERVMATIANNLCGEHDVQIVTMTDAESFYALDERVKITGLGQNVNRKNKLTLLCSMAIGGIKTESEAFNQRFMIQSQSQHDAFYILTPHMMEYILSMDAKGGGDTYMRFLREGKVHIAINSGRNAFEMGSLNTDVAALRQKFVGEIRYVTDIIDELRLVETLHDRASS